MVAQAAVKYRGSLDSGSEHAGTESYKSNGSANLAAAQCHRRFSSSTVMAKALIAEPVDYP